MNKLLFPMLVAVAFSVHAQMLPTAPTPTIPGGGTMSPTLPGATPTAPTPTPTRSGRMEYPFFTVSASSCDPVPPSAARLACVFPVFGIPSDAESCAKTTAKMLPQVKLDYARLNIQVIKAECVPFKP